MKRKIFAARGLHFIPRGLVAASLIAQMGCATPKLSSGPALTPPPVPRTGTAKAPQDRLPGLIVTEIETKREPEWLYSFSLRDADIREVLAAISKQTNFNVVVNPDVQGRATLDLKNVPLTEALDILTDLLDLSYRVKQNTIRVFKPIPETRIFSLHYVNLKRTAGSATSAQIGTSGAGATATAAPGGTGVTTGTSSGGSAGQTSVTTSTETDLWKEVEAGVGKLLSPAGKTVVDRQGGNILVTDLPKFLERIAGFLENVEGSVQRQVLIEARVIEVSLTADFRFGIDWGAVAQAGSFVGNTVLSPGSPARIIAQRLSPGTQGFQIALTSSNFEALLDTLSKQGEVNVLSSPKLLTLNNQTAVIRSATDDVFFERRVIQTVGASGTTVVTTEVIPRTVTIGVVLAVTPQVSQDGSVVLHVRPTVTEKTVDATFKDGATEFKVPVLNVREVDMVVRAREGEVIVLGGLIQNKRVDEERRVPILGDLPGIGHLFRQIVHERKKTELVVLLTPTVLVGRKVSEVTARDLERLRRLQGSSPW